MQGTISISIDGDRIGINASVPPAVIIRAFSVLIPNLLEQAMTPPKNVLVAPEAALRALPPLPQANG